MCVCVCVDVLVELNQLQLCRAKLNSARNAPQKQIQWREPNESSDTAFLRSMKNVLNPVGSV